MMYLIPRVPRLCHRYVGNKPSPHRRKALEKLHPAGLTDDWADKLAGREFFSHNLKATFEHYMQARPDVARQRPSYPAHG